MNFPLKLYTPHPDKLTTLAIQPAPQWGAPSRLYLRLLVAALLLLAVAALAIALALLLLDGGQRKCVARAAGRGLPQPVVAALVPGQGADPGLDVVVQAQLYAVGLCDARGGVRDLVLWALVLEGELASVWVPSALAHWSLLSSILCPPVATYLLGSIGFPAALFFSFRRVAGPMLARWSELGLVMIWSQMTAWFVAFAFSFPAAGHSAVT